MMERHARVARGFTIMELLVIFGIITMLVALVMPSLASVRERARMAQCASNLRELGTATQAYLNVYDNHLPQVAAADPFTGEEVIIGALFGGKAGEMEMYGANEIGADARPLNAFISGGPVTDEDVPVFHCPLDKGQPAQPPFVPEVDSMYDYIGTSYTLNDHTLDGDAYPTLVPPRTGTRPGGRMPPVAHPSRTWMLAPQPVYNYQEGGDRGQAWHRNGVIVNMCFVDGHVDVRLRMRPASAVDDDGYYTSNVTRDYTFYPNRDWPRLACNGWAPPMDG